MRASRARHCKNGVKIRERAQPVIVIWAQSFEGKRFDCICAGSARHCYFANAYIEGSVVKGLNSKQIS